MSGIRVTYSGLISLLGGIILIVTSSVFTVIVTRILPTIEYGTWGLINGLFVYVLMLSPILSYWATREIARGEKTGKSHLAGNGILSFAGIGVFLLISLIIGNETEANFEHLYFATILVPLLLFVNILTAINLGHKPESLAYGNIAYGATLIPTGLIFVYFLNLGIYGVIISAFIGHIANIVILIFFARSKIIGSIKKEYFKKWFKLFWIPSYPSLAIIIEGLDITIFTLITKSVHVLAFWTAALVIPTIISQSGLISKAVYPKLLESDKQEYVSDNLVHLFFFGILFTSITIAFAKPALFILNPVYQIAVFVVVILSVHMFLNVLINTFQLSLTGIEKIDANVNATFVDYIKSKLFFIPTIRLIQSLSYIVSLIIILLIFHDNVDDMELLHYWSITILLSQIPFVIFFFKQMKKHFPLNLSKPIMKYILSSVISFGLIFFTIEQIVDYDSNLYTIVAQIISFISISSLTYILITISIDDHSRKLVKTVIQALKDNLTRKS